MLAFLSLAPLFLLSLVNAAPSLDLAGAPTPAKMYSLAQRHARSTLNKRNECWVDTDCPVIANAFQSTCNPTRCCDVNCKPGFVNVDGQCHAQQFDASATTTTGCPAGKRLFNGACVAAPGSALSPKRQCSNDNDCTTGKGHAFATCQNGACSVVCWQGYQWNGQYCARASGYDCHQTGCVDGPAGSNLVGVCRADGRCSSVCAPGYTWGNGNTLGVNGQSQYRCYKSSPINSCANVTCKKINFGGVSTCNNGECTYTCLDAAKTPVLKASGEYFCENINNNPQCCGADCKRCPTTNSAYAGLGSPIPACQLGTCAFRCTSGSLKTGANGLPYCA